MPDLSTKGQGALSMQMVSSSSANELGAELADLRKANEEARDVRRATLNVLEDAVEARDRAERLYVELQQRQTWQRGQREALEMAVNGAPLEKSLGILVRTATEALGEAVRAGIYLASADGATLHHVVGMSREYAAAMDGFRIGPESLACGLASYCGEPILTEDVQADPRWASWRWLAKQFDYRGCWSFPIDTAAGGYAGTLAIYSREPRQATVRDLELASFLTNTASIIISQHTESQVRRQAEEALRASEERYRIALEAAELAAWDFNVRTDRVLWNEHHFLLLGLQVDSPQKRPADFLRQVHPEDLPMVQERLRSAVEESGVYRADFRIVRANDGAVRWMSGFGKTVEWREGKAVRMLGVMFDITEQRLAQQALENHHRELRAALQETEAARAEAESADKAKDHFLAVLSHELRTPLSPVLMATHVLGRLPNLPERIREAIEMMQRNLKVEVQLIDDLLDVTRITRGKFEMAHEPVDVHEVLRRALEVTQPDLRAKDLQLTVSLDAVSHHLHGDGARLQQAFWNLLKNAAKFTPTGREIRVRSWNEDGALLLSIQDSGIGISAEAIGKIFQPFTQGDATITRAFGGLGLGLAIARAAIEAHGGSIQARSEGQDRGATFTVKLPVEGK